MAAQNTWRLVFNSSNGSQYIQLTEVAFLDDNGVDLSVGGVASASSEYSATYSAAKAFDKSGSTDWCTLLGYIPAWLQYVHASAVSVSQVRITCSAQSVWLPPSAISIDLLAGSDQQDRYSLSVISGGFTPNAVVLLGATVKATPKGGLAPASIHLSGGMAGNAGPVLSPAAVRLDLQDGGLYRISNFVEQQGTPNAPVRRRVQLWNQRDSRMVRETWSDATTGAYVFEYIRGGDGTRYCAVAYDHTGNYQGVIADNLEPEAMPLVRQAVWDGALSAWDGGTTTWDS